jgi:hypothetical protein
VAAGPRLASVDAFAAEAQQFAESLSRTVQAVTGDGAVRFAADVSTDGRIDAHLRQEPREGIPFNHKGTTILRLSASLKLVHDHAEEHLKVFDSRFHVFPEGGKTPVFRYEYEQSKEDRTDPAAHVQFHGRHPDLEAAMVAAGMQRTRSTGRGPDRPNVTDLHFPVGGSRFRPCLEDVLEMLIHEFDLDLPAHKQAVLDALAGGRVHWRTKQLRTAIRDDPSTAADQLRTMGFEVSEPEEVPAVRMDQLRRL